MNPGVRQTALYFVSVGLGQALTFLLLPVVTRFLSAEAYGEYTLATTVSGLIAMIATAWVRNVGMRLFFDAVGRHATRAFYVTSALLQATLFTVLYGASLGVMAGLGVEFVSMRVMVSAGIAMVLSDQFNYATALLRAEQRAGPFALSEIASGVLRFGATVVGLYAGARSAAVLFDAASVGFAIAAVYAIPVLLKRLDGPAGFDAVGLRELLRTGPSSIPFSISAWLERLADRLVLEYFAGTAIVGIYSVGYVLGERIIASLAQAVFMMAWPSILTAWNAAGERGARAAILDAQRLFAWITVGPTLFLVAHGATLTRWIAGDAYRDAATIVPIVVVAMWLGAFGTYINRHLELRKRFGTLSAISMGGAIVNVGLNLLLVPRYGMTGAALATLANYVFNCSVFFATRDRVLGALNVWPFAVSAAAAALGFATGGLLFESEILRMSVFVAGYGLTALTVLVRFRTASGAPK